MLDLNGKTILLTGGTGSFGTAFIDRVTSSWPDAVVRVYSRDELKQSELRGRFVLISSEARPGEQGMGLFLQSEHFLVRPFSLEGLLDQAEEIGRGT